MDKLFKDEEFDNHIKQEQSPVTVLGINFANDEERRAYFREELRKKLPELKHIEGFPIGEDDDIINLSDPPYYTACPNPWINDFIAQWEEEKVELEKQGKRSADFVVDEPYASDVSEGKNAPIYNAHSYHTKVPHKAIMNYLLHYTEPGDIVLDAFSGSGMSAVATNSMDNVNDIYELGYKLNGDDIIKEDAFISLLGKRNIILNDLSPAATNLSYNNSFGVNIEEFKIVALKLLKEVQLEYDWMFKTKDPETSVCYDVEYYVWSEISCCDGCGYELKFSEIAFDDSYNLKENAHCLNCGKNINKRSLQPLIETYHDKELNSVLEKPRREVVLVCYKKGRNKRYKKPDNYDKEILERIESLDKSNIPTIKIPDMQMMRVGRMKPSKIQYIHQFYFDRIRYILTSFWVKSGKIKNKRIKELVRYWLDSHFVNLSFRNRYRPNVSFPYNPMTGVFYIPMMSSEANPFIAYENKLKKIITAFNEKLDHRNSVLISTGSASDNSINDNSIDYIFTDPPFGENIYYSDLNFFIESWNKVFTNTTTEAIIDKVKNKDGFIYNSLIESCFCEYFRVLKPGKWMTVVFSNTSASIWNGIQYALQSAGFVVANVSALDKKQGTFQAVNTTTAVKQDLVISCYKPSSEFDNRFQESKHSNVGVWDFVEEHLQHLPVHIAKDNATTAIIERSPKILYDRLIAFYVQRSLPVPIDAGEFQKGLKERFIERDGMYFTGSQVVEYDEKRKGTTEFYHASLFVSSEQDGVMWLKQQLKDNAQTYQELQPKWMQAIAGLRKGDILPELKDILHENFLQNENGAWYLPDLENEIDLEKLRTNRLLKLFAAYKEQASKPKAKIKEVRVEALRVGFKQCYKDKDFETIVAIAEKIPNNLLMEDEVLLQYYDIANTRVER